MPLCDVCVRVVVVVGTVVGVVVVAVAGIVDSDKDGAMVGSGSGGFEGLLDHII